MELQLTNRKEVKSIIDKLLNKIETAILEEYVDIKQQGNMLAGIENLYHQVRFCNPELALHIKKSMLQLAKEKGDMEKANQADNESATELRIKELDDAIEECIQRFRNETTGTGIKILIAEFEELMFLKTKLLTQMVIADQQMKHKGQ